MFSEVAAIPGSVVLIAQAVVAAAMLIAAWRVWAGPSIMDRVVALDLIAALIMAQFVMLVFRSGFVPYLDVAAAIAIISFLATIAFARYLERQETDK